MQNHLKTTSEWPQSGPVTPLQSDERFCGVAERTAFCETSRVEPRVMKITRPMQSEMRIAWDFFVPVHVRMRNIVAEARGSSLQTKKKEGEAA